MKRTMHTIYWLGIKELWSLWRDPAMLFLIVYAFTFAVYMAGVAMPESLNKTPIAIVDEDDSSLSTRLFSAFQLPEFATPERLSLQEVDPALDAGRYTLVLVIPVDFQRDLLAGRNPALQLNIDATRMQQAFIGSGFAQQVIQGEVNEFIQRYRSDPVLPVELITRARFNPSLSNVSFGSLIELIELITMLSIILTGAALIREKEHGTVEHLLVMPVTPIAIMLAKIWSMALVVLLAAALSLNGIIRWLLQVDIEGSIGLFFAGATLHLFATTAIGIYLATLARSMPQFGLLIVLVMLPLQVLSGGMTPRESMPLWLQHVMSLAPTTHFTELGQAILYRGADIGIVWPSMVWLIAIGAAFFALALRQFRRAIVQMV